MKRPQRKHEQAQGASAPAGAPTVDPAVGEVDIRARPGRRTVEERQHAVLELMAGKATIDQIARRLGVHAATVEGWRVDALGGVEQALRRGTGKTAAELELERPSTKSPTPRPPELERPSTKSPTPRPPDEVSDTSSSSPRPPDTSSS